MATHRPLRIVIFSMHLGAATGLDAGARALGHEPVALLVPRLRQGAPAEGKAMWTSLVSDAPDHLDVCIVPDKSRLERLVRAYEPDLGLCLGYRWLLTPEILAIPRLGVVNAHPSLLPRWRGPIPTAWAIREGDEETGLTFHLMDESFDTGPILAQGSRPMPPELDWETLEPLLAELGRELLPIALERVVRGDRGDPQDERLATEAPFFTEDMVELDLRLPAAVVHRHVRSWRFVPPLPHLPTGPLAGVDGRRVRVLGTSLVDPGDGASALACADGPLWVVESEPA